MPRVSPQRPRTMRGDCTFGVDGRGRQLYRPLHRSFPRPVRYVGSFSIRTTHTDRDTLEQDVQSSVATAQEDGFGGIRHDQAETIETGHGRIETHRAIVIDDPAVLDWLQARHRWPGLRAIGMIHAERRIGTKRTREDRYYLLSHPLSATAFGEAVRSHWGIENRVHWILDVTFHEDQSRIRAGHAAENFAVLRHIALNLLRQATTKRKSIKGRRLKAASDTDYLLQVLTSD
jgi:predicted transposase YbfD/YdcC